MAWNLPSLPSAGTVATVANWATKVIDCLRYLRGLDGVPTIESGLIIDNTDGDEYLKLPLLTTAECSSVLNAEGEVALDEQTHRIKVYDGTGLRSIVTTADVDDTAGGTNGATTTPVSTNVHYDHANAADPHTGYLLESLADAAGDIIYASGNDAWVRLAKGTENHYLKQGASLPGWAAGFSQVATGTYDGNDAASRQIAVGFKCSMVIIMNTAYGQANIIPNAALVHGTSSPYHASIDSSLHASDGFTVTNTILGVWGTQTTNKSGTTYYYWAVEGD